ncbi:PAS domain S-box-containing protein [Sinobacterium caligoides]|uniref:histidine kinase n=1 Tax=Sinobacterium caligoides TaxID=933926 RepID=A0A3N2D537_9GAMM|nr:response regulator [Sinobacterium caligoides]ROR94873.1 PAS domain S-box-containing protein [Sinobacterium caligoides]
MNVSTARSVLLVDDNPTNLQVLYKTLSDQGYHLLIARDGKVALQIAKSARPVLVLLDIMMPEMDGFEVCRRLKADPETASSAIIFLSALGDVNTKVQGFELGAVDYISKPFQAEEIVARVATHVRLRELEEQLAAKNKELSSENARILSTMADGVCGLDAEGRITYVNNAAQYLSGYTEAELLNRSCYQLLFEREEQLADINMATVIHSLSHGKKLSNLEFILFAKDGSKRLVMASCTPATNGQEVIGFVMVFRDITDFRESQRQLERAREELQSQQQHLAHIERLSTMGEMAAGFAHEVNQPLTAISNYASVAVRFADKEPIDKEKLKDILVKMAAQAVRASEVIKRLRNFVKKPVSGIAMQDPNDLIQDVVTLAEVDGRNNNVPVFFTPLADAPVIAMDSIQIQQVALNLVRNAMEAMAASEHRELGVVIQLEIDRPGYITVAVKDRGHGLADDAEERLFHPFYTTKEEGMGIGLSVCHSIIQSHQGEIGFLRNPEGGTTFYFTLPLQVQ